MRIDILNFIEDVKKTFKLDALYFPRKDVYSLRLRGRGVQNFSSQNFYQIPKAFRKQQIRGIIMKGLNHNLGEKTLQNQMFINNSIGRKI